MEKVYLAARYSRREELLQYREELERFGMSVTSRWLDGNHQIDDEGLSAEAKAGERERFASEDYGDVFDADTVISFTETPRSSNSRGGRHVEFGVALGLGKRVVVIGPRENVFHCLPTVEYHLTWEEFVAMTVVRERYGMDVIELVARKLRDSLPTLTATTGGGFCAYDDLSPNGKSNHRIVARDLIRTVTLAGRGRS